MPDFDLEPKQNDTFDYNYGLDIGLVLLLKVLSLTSASHFVSVSGQNPANDAEKYSKIFITLHHKSNVNLSTIYSTYTIP